MLLLFTRDKQMSASTFVQDPHAQFGSHIVLGVGTTPERLLQEQLLLSIATSSSERCTMAKLHW